MNGRQLFHFVTFLRVIVSYLDVLRLVVRPVETDTPLIIDADAVLTLPISFQYLKIDGWLSSPHSVLIQALRFIRLSVRLWRAFSVANAAVLARSLSARFTESVSGKTSMSSGSINTRLVPAVA